MKTNEWTIKRANESGVYAYKGDEWMTFNDPEMVRHRAKFIQDHNLFGAVVSTLLMDDHANQCGQGKYPLTSTLHMTLRNHTTMPPDNNNKTETVNI